MTPTVPVIVGIAPSGLGGRTVLTSEKVILGTIETKAKNV